MKKISSFLIVAISLLFCIPANAQTGSVPVEKIQKLLNKAVGQKYMNLMGNDEKITKQVITENTYTLYYTGLGKYGSKWVLDYTSIQWGKGFNHFSAQENGNSKLTRFVFEFKDKHGFHMHVEGENDNDKSTRNSLEFYVLTKDADEMSSLIKNN